MASANPFDLLGDDDNDDPSQMIAVRQQKIAAKKPAAPATSAAVKFPTKPVPPSQAGREAGSGAAPTRGGVGRGGPGRGRGGRGVGTGPNRDFGDGNANGFSGGYGGGGGVEGDAGRPPERDRGPRPPFRGGRRGGYGYGEGGGDSERPPRRMYERRSGTGRGATDENANADGKILAREKQPEQDDAPSSEANKKKDAQANEAEEKEPDDKEMTLEEYEKIREEKRKALLAMKTEERKVEIDKELQSMQQLSLKKRNDDVFIKLGSDKDVGKKKDDRDERAKKV
ncbi:RGG repeats nuclear RNA binding protein A [Cocos nucifera]|uniref:RGG repeats nuclear RNA binding protein A n=1 Tax=Cocos nucifera TaxID=13894 RepID=A0A8K0N322_COCNU|nr:RGG repeats nuclear RNA binding protein A [Cocos nucifera]